MSKREAVRKPVRVCSAVVGRVYAERWPPRCGRFGGKATPPGALEDRRAGKAPPGLPSRSAMVAARIVHPEEGATLAASHGA